MRTRRLQGGFAALLLIAALFVACAAHAQTVAGSTDTYRIAGRVVDGVSGEPVVRATVSLLTGEDYSQFASAITDAEGRFAFGNVPAGKYPLTAAKRGYRTSYFDEHEDFNSAIVAGKGQDTEHLEFRLPPGAILRGVVSDDGGDPVEGAQVLLFRRRSGEANESPEQAGATETDDTGAYEFPDLAAGAYLVAVKGDPWYAQHGIAFNPRAGEPSPLDVAYPVTYYDSTTEEASAASIALAPGTREQADINLHAVPALHFKLTAPLRIPRVTFRQTVFGTLVGNASVTLPPGRTEFLEPGIAPGQVEIEMGDPPRTQTLNATSNLDLDPTAGTPALSIDGTLMTVGGGAIHEGVSLTLASVDNSHEAQVAPVAQGRFHFHDVPPGNWRLIANSDKQSLAVVATSAGGLMKSGDRIVVQDRPVAVAIMVSRAQAHVRGFAQKDGKPAPGAMIVLIPKNPAAFPALVRRDQSDSDGSFDLRNAAPGDYTVVAIEDGWGLEWQRREVLERYVRGGLDVRIGETAGTVPLAKTVAAVPR